MIPTSQIIDSLDEMQRESAKAAIKTLRSTGFLDAAINVSRESLLATWDGRDKDKLAEEIHELNTQNQVYEVLKEAAQQFTFSIKDL